MRRLQWLLLRTCWCPASWKASAASNDGSFLWVPRAVAVCLSSPSTPGGKQT